MRAKLFLSLLLLTGCCMSESAVVEDTQSEKAKLFFREDWQETPPGRLAELEYVQNPLLIAARRGPGCDGLNRSNHDNIPHDPWYIWSGPCEGRWALTLEKKDALVDLSSMGRIRLRTKQSGPNVLKIVLGLDDGAWLVSSAGFGETPDWHVFSVEIGMLGWHRLNIDTIEAGERIKEPDLHHVRSIGFTDLMKGGGSPACVRLDWIEVYGKEIQP